MNCEVRLPARHEYLQVIEEIASLDWSSLSHTDVIRTAYAYYYFSVQFRESLVLACEQHPDDESLQSLREGECDTDNLSPFPGIAAPGERMNHDEFMRRILTISSLDAAEAAYVEQLGKRYLAATRAERPEARAMSIASYEDGGLEAVFRAILRAPSWQQPGLKAFRHFLVEHIRFDSDDEAGHGALCRHLSPDDSVLPLWVAFRDLLTAAVPALAVREVAVHA